jgi:hypothetical protein
MTTMSGLLILLAAAVSFVAGSWMQSINLSLARRLSRKTWARQANQLDGLRGQVRYLTRMRAEDSAEIDRLNQWMADVRLCRCENTHDLLRRFVMVDKQPVAEEEKTERRKALEKEANLIWVTALQVAVSQGEKYSQELEQEMATRH